jgi:hypothetical protein
MAHTNYDASGDVLAWAAIALTDATATQIVAAVAGYKIRVVSGTFTAGAATNLAWKSAANTIIPAMPFGGAGGGMDFDRGASGGWLMETNVGEALLLQQSAVTNLYGSLNYKLVPA